MSKGILLVVGMMFLTACAITKSGSRSNTAADPSTPLPKEAQYWQLQGRTYDEMEESVNERVNKANEEIDENPDGAKDLLREALEIVFARPNLDNIVSQLITEPRSSLRDLNAYELILTEIVTNAINITKDPVRKVTERATALIMLENIMTEVRPQAKSNKDINRIFKTVANANIVIDDAVASHLRMKAMMKRPASPSAIAQSVLKNIRPKSRR